MNILPKKSWHVRNKDNVAKVRKDEEDARLEAKEQSRRAALAEQESRTNYLRDKARSRALENSDDLKELLNMKADSAGGSSVALFNNTAAKIGFSRSMKNEEHEQEKKQEQEKYEKKIGLLTYLGQSAAETMNDCEKPWYFKVPENRSRKRHNSSSDAEPEEKEQKRKVSLDPIEVMKSHLQKKKLADKHSKKNKKRKRKHRHRSMEKEVIPRSSDKLAKLREERLKREKKEKERTRALLNGSETASVPEAPGRYNSQFNPHLVRAKGYSGSRYK